MFAGANAPFGYLECNGAALSRAAFPDLFNAIGSIYGSTETTFNLPDLRGEFVRGYDNDRGVDDGRAMGSTQDDATAVNGLSVSDSGHSHGVTDPGHNHTTTGRSTSGLSVSQLQLGAGGQTFQVTSSSNTTGISVSNGTANVSASSSDTETRPRNVALMYCIKT